MTLLEALTTPYADGNDYATGEQLRAAVLDAVLPRAGVQDQAVRVYSWVLQSDLRSFFPGAPALNGIFITGPTPIEIAATLLNTAPKPRAVERLRQTLGLPQALMDALKPYLTNSLPQRRVEGYCALACLCAQERMANAN